jgi:hypothetical protein
VFVLAMEIKNDARTNCGGRTPTSMQNRSAADPKLAQPELESRIYIANKSTLAENTMYYES